MECQNYRSVTCQKNRDRVETQIKEEIANGRCVVSKDKPLVITALGAIPKLDSTDLRLIHDCSRPKGQGVNHYALPKKFRFETIDNAIKHDSPGAWMAKVDLKSAYRHVGLNPSEFKMTGLKYRFSGDSNYTYMFDSRLPLGASESVGCFHRISRSIVKVARRRSRPWNCHIIGYLDDFLVIGASRRDCQAAVHMLLQLLSELGFTVNWTKFYAPSQLVIFLGIEINSVSETIRIP